VNILARLKRIGLLVISRGFGGTGGPAPTPPIITGPCMTAQVANVATPGVVGNAAMATDLLPAVSISLLFGNVATSGVVANSEIEGVAIDAC